MRTEELLARIPMFEALADDDRQALAQSLTERRFAAGEIIMNLGDRGTSMFIVAEGHINIYLPGEASRRISLKDITTGEHLGELALFDDKPRSASAVATTDAVLLELDRETLSTYLAQRPQGAMTLLRTLAARLRATNEMLSQRAAKNVVAELESRLTWSQKLADRVASLNGSWAFILMLLGLTLGWIAVNAILIGGAFDPYPYVFFNLLLAILVALQGPLIVMSQNRSSLKDRAQAETDFQVNLKNEVNIETLLRELGEMRAEMNQRLATVEAERRRSAG
jgi:CRP/FNR family cyclic AMP-dependent transcriptional regulator